jgi:hypothetical protein
MIMSTIYSNAGEFAAVLAQGQFYPEPGDNATFKPSEGLDPFFMSWALTGHRTFIQKGTKAHRYQCAGCVTCSQLCGYVVRPRTRGNDAQFCGNTKHHRGENVPLVHQPCQVHFEYRVNLMSGGVDMQCSSEGNAGHSHLKPPPKSVGLSSAMDINAMLKGSGKRPTATQILLSSEATQSDQGAQDTRRLQRKISELYSQRYGQDLSITGLRYQEFTEPIVRDVRVSFGDGSCPETNFDFVFLQLDGQHALTKDLGSSHGSLTSKYLYADVTYKFGTTYRMTIMTDSLESGKGVKLAVVLLTRLHSEAYARVFYQFLKLNPALWSVVDHKLVQNFCCLVVDFSDSQQNGFLMAVQKLWVKQCPSSSPFTPSDKTNFLSKSQKLQVSFSAKR